jgi:hypothetical protein
MPDNAHNRRKNMSTACTIENIECFTQVEAQSGSMVFVLHDAAGKAHTLGMFHRNEQRWYAPLSYPNRTASPLVPDVDLSALRTILFLNGAADIAACIAALQAFACKPGAQQRHAA